MIPTTAIPGNLRSDVMAPERPSEDRSPRRHVSTGALVLALFSVLALRLSPAVGHLHIADLIGYVLPQLLAAAGAAGALRAIARRSGLRDGPLQSIAVLLAGLGALEFVGFALDAAHAVGTHGLTDHGGWTAVPVALGLGSTVGVLTCAATAQIRRFVAAQSPRERRVVVRVARVAPIVLVSSGTLIARNLAGRAPPVLSR